ncbi:MAG: c-type cytochrome [Magnetovibrio sp.]|nr:c-type cytochrome [Magnetovibrio sp.]
MRLAIAVTVATLLSLALPTYASQTELRDKTPEPAKTQMPSSGHAKPLTDGVRALQGVAIYRRDCQACHGKTGAGNGTNMIELATPVPNFTVAESIVNFPPDKMISSLMDGHKIGVTPTDMAALSDQEIRDVVRYIQDAFMLPAYTSDASAGRQIYARTCSVCHGDRGNSVSWAQNSLDPSPFDFTSYKAKKLSRRHMINTVTYGSDGTAMVGWATQLSKEDIAAVVDYVQATFIFPDQILSSDRPKHGAADADTEHGINMVLPFDDGLTGNLEKGEKVFQLSCAPCHGKNGDGDGPRAYFIFPKPENFTSKRARAELNRPHLFSSISDGIVGTVMPSWSKVLSDQQMADVAEYVFTSFIVEKGVEQALPPNTKSDDMHSAQKKTSR